VPAPVHSALLYGPAEGVMDYGARLITAFGSVIDSNDPEEIESILDGIPDPAGQFYRFNLAGSLLRAGKTALTSRGIDPHGNGQG
jgi:F420-non-reducing hydrogenase small subunit